MAYSPDGRRIAVSGQVDQALGRGHGPADCATLPGPAHDVAFSPDGRRLAANDSSPADGSVKVWDAETGRELLSLPGHTGAIWGVAFSPDGTRIASGGLHG